MIALSTKDVLDCEACWNAPVTAARHTPAAIAGPPAAADAATDTLPRLDHDGESAADYLP
ncbi:hypothetical protein DTB58_28310 [Streptomyces griseus]|uniref:hypothetical protein n=1 Tax=Streptomyces griseus TaxID=1911 RepID=UPI001C5A1C90|nr:hypothetical protein [Streptomyces griseus]MBW3707778.1 hypothetical protein [Streptomyces griseus]